LNVLLASFYRQTENIYSNVFVLNSVQVVYQVAHLSYTRVKCNVSLIQENTPVITKLTIDFANVDPYYVSCVYFDVDITHLGEN